MSLRHGKNTFQSDNTPWSHIFLIRDNCNLPVRRRNSIDVERAFVTPAPEFESRCG